MIRVADILFIYYTVQKCYVHADCDMSATFMVAKSKAEKNNVTHAWSNILGNYVKVYNMQALSRDSLIFNEAQFLLSCGIEQS